MREAHDNLERLVGRVYRRLVMVRLVEGLGLGVLGAAGLALIFLLILLGRGEAVPAMVFGMLPVGGTVGILWAMMRRPGTLDAAMEADRQLNLADLLSTALAVVGEEKRGGERQHPTAQAFAEAVVAMADARCERLAASEVVLHRLGKRAWGGIGLVVALVVSLGLVAGNPLEGAGSTLPRGSGVGLARVPMAQAQQAGVMVSRGASERTRPMGGDYPNQEDENAFNPARASSSMARMTGESRQGAEAADPQGAGPGVGTSRAKNGGDGLKVEGTQAAGGTVGQTAAGGAGVPSENGAGEPGRSGGVVGGGRARGAAPVWQSSAWPTAQSAAETAIVGGRIPSEYHDLIRAYFDR